MESRRDVFQAIVDPNRRAILDLVARKTMTMNSIAGNFDISRPAISQHIKILTECGLIVIRQEGRERYCEAKLEQLKEIAGWVEQYRIFWTDKLDALGLFLEQDQIDTSTSAKKKPKKKSKKHHHKK